MPARFLSALCESFAILAVKRFFVATENGMLNEEPAVAHIPK
jgi:hypothetical protein